MELDERTIEELRLEIGRLTLSTDRLEFGLRRIQSQFNQQGKQEFLLQQNISNLNKNIGQILEKLKPTQ